MRVISRLEELTGLDRLVEPGQKLAKLIPSGRFKDALHGVWLGHPVHPPLVQVPVGAWFSASIIGLHSDGEPAARVLSAIGLAGAVPAALAGLADWADQHEQQMLGEVPVIAIRRDGQVHVLADRCSHMSGSLAEGELSGTEITCPWHGSVFCISDGSVVHGPATAPQPSFETRLANGVVEVRLPNAG